MGTFKAVFIVKLILFAGARKQKTPTQGSAFPATDVAGIRIKNLNLYYFTLRAPRSSLIVKFVTSQTSLGPQYWIGPG